jgi:hypothetical protein
MMLFDLPQNPTATLETARRELVRLETECEEEETRIIAKIPMVEPEEEAGLHRLIDRKNAALARVYALEGEAMRRARE